MATAPTCYRCNTAHWSTQTCGARSESGRVTKAPVGKHPEAITANDMAIDALRVEVQALTKRVKALEAWRETVTVARAAARRADNAGDNANDNAITRAAKNQRAYRARKKGASDAVR
jgi:hypothetical protein